MSSKKLKSTDDTKWDFKTVLKLNKPISDIKFTKNRLFALTENGEVYVYFIEEIPPEREALSSIEIGEEYQPNGLIDPQPIQIKEL